MEKIIALVLLLTYSLNSAGLDAHVHGRVELDIATDRNNLLILLKAPSESFVGFEYKALSSKEKLHVKKIKKQWKENILDYFELENFKDCNVESSKWKQLFSGISHSSIIAESNIKCMKPLKSRGLRISLKKHFYKIRSINIQLLRENGSILKKEYKQNVFQVNL